MEYTKLGNSDLNVSRICMGCMGFSNAKSGMHSWTVDEEHSREILKRGLELGVNFLIQQPVIRAEEIANGVSGKEHIVGLLDRSLTNLCMAARKSKLYCG